MTRLFRCLLPLALAAAAAPTHAAPAPAASGPGVTIKVVGIESVKGNMMIALYDEKSWSGAAVARARVAVNGNTVTVVRQAPAPGRYGIKMDQDVNGNGEMDTNLVGMPTEPVGFSNDAPIGFGPPAFAAAAFEVGPAGASQTITVK
jgi:uncharacterized protein (DUF2141 family)